MTNYVDDKGLIVMENGDGGDSLQKTTFAAVGQSLNREHFPSHSAAECCEVSPGIWVRNPDTTKWYSNPLNTSRDQISSMIVWAGFAKQQGTILRQLVKQVKRLGFYQNVYPNWTSPGDAEYVKKIPDIASPEHWMSYYRALTMCHWTWKLALPVMYLSAHVTDLFMLAGTLINIYKGHRDPNFADLDNALMATAQADNSFHTLPSYLSKQLMLRYTPVAGYTDESLSTPIRELVVLSRGEGLRSALNWKYRSARGAPPIHEVWSKVIEGWVRSSDKK